MKLSLLKLALLVMAALPVSAQMASHAPTLPAAAPADNAPSAANAEPTVALNNYSQKPVARVNGTVLTESDMVHEMYAIFPYAQMHNGIPKSMEKDMRRGALDMIVFDELVYQEAKRRNIQVPALQLKKAEDTFVKRFGSDQLFQAFLKSECKGSRQVMRDKLRRSLMIEAVTKAEIKDRSRVSEADAKTYYEKNPAKFEHPEMFKIQTISFIPPKDSNRDALAEARKRAESAYEKAKAAKNYQEFGLLAEKVSDDDWHVKLGDRGPVEAEKLPPEVVKAAEAMKTGEVSPLIQLGTAFTMFRLNDRVRAGRTPFDDVKKKLMSDLTKERTESLRVQLNQKLRKSATIELL